LLEENVTQVLEAMHKQRNAYTHAQTDLPTYARINTCVLKLYSLNKLDMDESVFTQSSEINGGLCS
jgi:hypothetical protein